MPRPWKPLRRRANRKFAGYPVATVAFYGPNDHRATKVAVAIVPEEGLVHDDHPQAVTVA